MAASQTTIQFKAQKRTNLRNRKIKSNCENYNYLNIGESNDRKRPIAADDHIVPAKIKRNDNFCDKQKDERDAEDRISLKSLPSRETEIDFLKSFLTKHLGNEKSGSLYISGQPGTGKTATLSYILQLDQFRNSFRQVYVNCTMVKSAASIYSRVCRELKLKTSATSEKACLNAIEKHLSKKHEMILLVLDEIDQLDSKHQAVLYTIFEWPALSNGLVLIGIANALDLTERSLPRLQTRCSLKPQLLHFAPYTKEQIIHIFTTILTQEDNSNIFSPVALQMLAAKISAISGDMRRALDIGRRVIELAKRAKFADSQSLDKLMSDSSITVELKQVLQVLNEVYGGSSNIQNDVDDDFPMQQKIVLCSLMLLLTKGKNKDVTVGKLYDVYKKVAVSRNISPLEAGEMFGVVGLLEARGALRVTSGSVPRNRRLALLWDQRELSNALKDKTMLASILEERSLAN